MHGITIKKVLFLGLLSISAGYAQLANTIWEAEVPINGLSLQAIKEDVLQKGPNIKNATVMMPIEIWFWDDVTCGIVFPNEKWNQRVVWEDSWSSGSPGDPWYQTYWSRFYSAKYQGGGSLAPSNANESGKETAESYFDYNSSKKTGTLMHKVIYNTETSSHRIGSYWQIRALFAISGTRLTVKSATFALLPNPLGGNGFKFLSPLPSIKKDSVFLKTARKPSIEKNVKAAFDSVYETSWDQNP
jgi:hypothetical protein